MPGQQIHTINNALCFEGEATSQTAKGLQGWKLAALGGCPKDYVKLPFQMGGYNIRMHPKVFSPGNYLK
eukprot:NODE_6162_length_527_cov_37.100418_g5401_i0.p3 GENE.NODE_6162_length_527_cov_37.100418_g5401_i0~~NODE_6162_length_527_cov_37.100418_g5401_i0.p3  ORF type:complete len:69 (-),score=19.30 NODE_6162_length_527_cov_37.100418_g5401_i0:105-311(-)